MKTSQLEILYEDERFVAINKPPGLLVHRTKLAYHEKRFALQMLRDQIGQYVYPIHRLDRKTSGVLLFAKNKEDSRLAQRAFQERKVRKTYYALVRGFIYDSLSIDYPLGEEGSKKDARSDIQAIQRYEIPIGLRYPSSRYTLLQIIPHEGRHHQIRKHLAHIFHPIIGDRPHGCNKQNKFWKERFNMTQMLLHARQLELTEPLPLSIRAPYNEVFKQILKWLVQYEVN